MPSDTEVKLHAEDLSPAATPASTLADFVRTSGLNSVVLGASKDPNAKVTILLVSPRDGRPVQAVKVPTTDAAAQAVEAEGQALEALATVAPPLLARTIPRVVSTVLFRGRTALVMTAVHGTPMTTSYFRWRHTGRRSSVAADFAAVGAWLAPLHEATAGERAPIDVLSDLEPRLLARFADDRRIDADAELLDGLRSRLAEETTPRTAVHGDFWFGNVLLDGTRASGVVDWEYAALAGDPARDLARFALMYALYLDRRSKRGSPAGHPGLRTGTFGAATEYALNGTGWFPELFRDFLGDGLARLGASPARWRELALVGIAEVAAVTDHDDFARQHLDLFRRLATGSPR